jgi:hypothetical protein
MTRQCAQLFFFVLLVYYVYNHMFLHFFKTHKMYKIHKPLPVSGFHRPIIRNYQSMWSCELYINPSSATCWSCTFLYLRKWSMHVYMYVCVCLYIKHIYSVYIILQQNDRRQDFVKHGLRTLLSKAVNSFWFCWITVSRQYDRKIQEVFRKAFLHCMLYVDKFFPYSVCFVMHTFIFDSCRVRAHCMNPMSEALKLAQGLEHLQSRR